MLYCIWLHFPTGPGPAQELGILNNVASDGGPAVTFMKTTTVMEAAESIIRPA